MVQLLSRLAITFHLGHPPGGSSAGPRTLRETRKPLKVTIDSTEPLADAIRVIGALYNVNLGEVADDADAIIIRPAQDQPPRAATSTPARRSRAKTAKVSSPSGTGRRRRAPAADSSDVRAWAVANGHTVSDRGTLPAAVKAAYAEAHKG